MAPVIGLSAAPVLLREVLSPPRTAPRTASRTPPGPDASSGTPRTRRQSIRTTRARPPTPESARRRATRHREAEHANRRPAAHRRNPAQRPDRSPTRNNEPPRRPRGARADASRSHDARSDASIETTNQAQRRGHSRTGVNLEKRHRGTEPPTRSDHGRRTAPPTHPRNQAGDQDRDDAEDDEDGLHQRSTGTTHSPNASSDRTSTRGSQHHEGGARRAHEEPLQERTSSGTFVHSADDENRGKPRRMTARCGAAKRPGSSTIGTQQRDEKPPPTDRREQDQIHP